jgi:hypothetical protein
MPEAVAGGVNPIGLAFTLVMGLLIVIVPRRYAFVPIIILTCYMTMGNAIVVGGLHFTMIRVLLLFGWIRVVVRGEIRSIRLNSIDRIVLWWSLSAAVTYVLLWQNGDSIVYELGQTYNALGFYFLFRMLVRNYEDIFNIFKLTAVLITPLAISMIVEKAVGRNAFFIFGGVPMFTSVREGTLRCQGPFAHPILAGTFGATLMPFFVALWKRHEKTLATVGLASSLAITLTSGSSGPALACAAAVLALCMWRWRKSMRVVRWGIALTLIGLHLVMKAPVWFIIARVDVFSGSTGFHRAYLIDRAIANIGDWWLVGTKSTEHWAVADSHLFDVTNHYIAQGANGGLITMILFIVILVRCYRGVGLSVRSAEKFRPYSVQFGLWTLGGALFAHSVSFISVSYFDQNFVNWYLLLAMISTAVEEFLQTPRPVRTTVATKKTAETSGETSPLPENQPVTTEPRLHWTLE